MLRWARGNTKKDHVNNEDIRKEANIEPMTTFLRERRLRWYGHVLRNERGIPPIMLNMQVQGKRRRAAQEEVTGQHQRRHERVQDDEDMAHNRSVWHMKTKAGPLLHGGGL